MLENRVYQFTFIGLYTYLYLNYDIEQYILWNYGCYEKRQNLEYYKKVQEDSTCYGIVGRRFQSL